MWSHQFLSETKIGTDNGTENVWLMTLLSAAGIVVPRQNSGQGHCVLRGAEESPFGSLSGVGRGRGIDWDLGISQPLGEESTQQLETATKGGRAGAIKKIHSLFSQLVSKIAQEVRRKMRAEATYFVHRSCFHTHLPA